MFKVQRSLIKNSKKIRNKAKGKKISLSSQKKSSKFTILYDVNALTIDIKNA